MYLLILAKLLVLKFKFKIMLSVTWMYLHRNQILLSFHAGSTEPTYCLEIGLSFDIYVYLQMKLHFVHQQS